MAGSASVALFSESRLPGSDGAYTDQKIFKVTAGSAILTKLAHDLGRIPDWVRVERLATVDPNTGVPILPQSYVLPLIKETLADGRFEWEDTVGPLTIDLTEELFFAAAGAQGDGLLLVELGITHSASK